MRLTQLGVQLLLSISDCVRLPLVFSLSGARVFEGEVTAHARLPGCAKRTQSEGHQYPRGEPQTGDGRGA